MNQNLRNKHADEYAELFELVHAVLEKYAEVCELPLVAASQLDEDGDPAPPRVLLPGSTALHFRLDCERITERILDDDPDLQAAWFSMAQEQPIPFRVEQRLVTLLGTPYRAIRPSAYFRPVRNGSALSHRRSA